LVIPRCGRTFEGSVSSLLDDWLEEARVEALRF
jgi:hypothetical protein